ncbi:MAG: hypothetical protein ACYC91_00775 [Solirubrobacteraceae bacterium]
MLWRPAARLLTGPAAFLAAALVDLTLFALVALVRRLRSTMHGPWEQGSG